MISVNIFKLRNLISALSLLIFERRTGSMNVKMGSFIYIKIF